MNPVERFIKYTKVDTQSDDTTGTTPSTEKQKNLSRLLVEELKELGVNDAYMDEYGIVYGHLKGEGDMKLGFNAHVDTALEVTGANVNAQIIKNFNGVAKLNDELSLTVDQFPALKKHIGKDIVVTDGTTLLGADDKAGIAIIMSALEYFHEHPEVKHKNLSISFTVDEEIGEGPKHFSLEKMDADYAYTIDGGDIESIEIENFNAKGVQVNIKGVSVHPGEGKNALINACLLLNELINAMPKGDTPFEAGFDDGYWHINGIEGEVDHASMSMILRDFDKEKLNRRAEILLKKAEELNKQYPKAHVDVKIYDQYENMREYVDKDPTPVNMALEVLKKHGLNPRISKIRGGTDGATFSKMGLLTPNLGTASSNHHGRYEYLVIQDFEKMIEIVKDLMKY